VAVLRTLHQSDKINAVSEGAELLYRRLLEVVDDNGNYYAEPGLILGYIFAHRMANNQLTTNEMAARVQELATAELVQFYADGRLLHIVDHFTKLRSDVTPDIRFDPCPARMRNGRGPGPARMRPARLDQTRLDQTEPDETEPSGDSASRNAPGRSVRKPKDADLPTGYQKQVLALFAAAFNSVYGEDWKMLARDAAGARQVCKLAGGDFDEVKRKLDLAVDLARAKGKYAPFPKNVPAFAGKWNNYTDAALRQARDDGKRKVDLGRYA